MLRHVPMPHVPMQQECIMLPHVLMPHVPMPHVLPMRHVGNATGMHHVTSCDMTYSHQQTLCTSKCKHSVNNSCRITSGVWSLNSFSVEKS